MHPHDTTKACNRCGLEKPLTEFYTRKESPDGHRKECKACFLVAQQNRHHNRPDRDQVLAKMRKYSNNRYRNSDERRAYQANWLREQRRSNPGQHQRWARDYKKRRWARDPQYRALIKQRLTKHTHQRRLTPEGRAVDARNARRYHQQHYYSDLRYRRRVLMNAKIHAHRRRARLRAVSGAFTKAEWIALCAHYNHRCLRCGETKQLTPDHVIPLSRGGNNDISNIQPLCLDCNLRKSTKTIDYRPTRSAS